VAGCIAGCGDETAGAFACGATVGCFFLLQPVIKAVAASNQIPSWDEWRFITTILPLYRALEFFWPLSGFSASQAMMTAFIWSVLQKCLITIFLAQALQTHVSQ
jgi:hypothetical protein